MAAKAWVSALPERTGADALVDDVPGADSQSRTLHRLLWGFHPLSVRLGRRSRGRPGLQINDEYDVQHVLAALLAAHYDDVRAEEPVPSHAGSGSRIDFLLPTLATGIEVKFIKNPGQDAQVGGDMLIDVARYRSHPGCRHSVFFVYGPAGYLVNPSALMAGVRSEDPAFGVTVIIAPGH